MNKDLISFLKKYKKKTITLGELERLFPGDITYNYLAENILELINNNILTEINPQKTNGKEIPLPLKFGINKFELRKEYIINIESYAFKFNKEIDLQGYFNLEEKEWEKDLPYINKINDYININGMPSDYVTPQERSFHITGDEKWIDENGGKRILERIRLLNKLKIIGNSDPLMLAINPNKVLNLKSTYFHLIVENKATFLALLDILPETNFTSLIFGYGWKIVGNINMLEKQIPVKGIHKIFYFGDLDNEGISIWNSLNEKISINLASEFYKSLLKKNYSLGKENQFKNSKAVKNFLMYFKNDEQKVILDILNNGGYLPQEGLNKDELREIWRSTNWI